MQAKAAQTMGSRTVDDLIASGTFICGSPATVRDRLVEYQKLVGFGNFLALLQFGTLPHDLTVASMERFATRVMPELRERAAEAAA
jgi:alkanesulfonate monooxygenase SsuD/methylene tetrahydromethanopterin reductase-like flavin-dependent oxidoreductase (luciferase family)